MNYWLYNVIINLLQGNPVFSDEIVMLWYVLHQWVLSILDGVQLWSNFRGLHWRISSLSDVFEEWVSKVWLFPLCPSCRVLVQGRLPTESQPLYWSLLHFLYMAPVQRHAAQHHHWTHLHDVHQEIYKILFLLFTYYFDLFRTIHTIHTCSTIY